MMDKEDERICRATERPIDKNREVIDADGVIEVKAAKSDLYIFSSRSVWWFRG